MQQLGHYDSCSSEQKILWYSAKFLVLKMDMVTVRFNWLIFEASLNLTCSRYNQFLKTFFTWSFLRPEIERFFHEKYIRQGIHGSYLAGLLPVFLPGLQGQMYFHGPSRIGTFFESFVRSPKFGLRTEPPKITTVRESLLRNWNATYNAAWDFES